MKKIINIVAGLFARGVWAANSIPEGVHSDGAVSFEAAAEITRGQIVCICEGKIKPATGSSIPVGVADDDAVSGDVIAVLLFGSRPGTLIATASAAITAGQQLYSEADGKVSPTAPTAGNSKYCVGVALTPATASGDNVEIAHCIAREIETPAL